MSCLSFSRACESCVRHVVVEVKERGVYNGNVLEEEEGGIEKV